VGVVACLLYFQLPTPSVISAAPDSYNRDTVVEDVYDMYTFPSSKAGVRSLPSARRTFSSQGSGGFAGWGFGGNPWLHPQTACPLRRMSVTLYASEDDSFDDETHMLWISLNFCTPTYSWGGPKPSLNINFGIIWAILFYNLRLSFDLWIVLWRLKWFDVFTDECRRRRACRCRVC